MTKNLLGHQDKPNTVGNGTTKIRGKEHEVLRVDQNIVHYVGFMVREECQLLLGEFLKYSHTIYIFLTATLLQVSGKRS